jgi:hypothetical protein
MQWILCCFCSFIFDPVWNDCWVMNFAVFIFECHVLCLFALLLGLRSFCTWIMSYSLSALDKVWGAWWDFFPSLVEFSGGWRRFHIEILWELNRRHVLGMEFQFATQSNLKFCQNWTEGGVFRVCKLNLNRRWHGLGMEAQFEQKVCFGYGSSICYSINFAVKFCESWRTEKWCITGTEGYFLLYHSQLLGHKILGHEKPTTMEAFYSWFFADSSCTCNACCQHVSVWVNWNNIRFSLIWHCWYHNCCFVYKTKGTKSISSSAQCITLQKYFSHPSFSYLPFFPSPPIKLKPGLQKGGRLVIATHLDQSNYLANQEQVLGFAVPFTSLSKLCKNAGPKPFCWAKLACFDFSSSNFYLQGHILSTGGVALTVSHVGNKIQK